MVHVTDHCIRERERAQHPLPFGSIPHHPARPHLDSFDSPPTGGRLARLTKPQSRHAALLHWDAQHAALETVAGERGEERLGIAGVAVRPLTPEPELRARHPVRGISGKSDSGKN